MTCAIETENGQSMSYHLKCLGWSHKRTTPTQTRKGFL